MENQTIETKYQVSTESKTMNLPQKLVQVSAMVVYVKKGEQGYNYKYANFADLIGLIKAKIIEMNLLLVPRMTDYVSNANGKGSIRATIEYTWMNADNPAETLSSSFTYEEPKLGGCQGSGSIQTYAERYFLYKFFQVATDEDSPEAFYTKHGLSAFIDEELLEAKPKQVYALAKKDKRPAEPKSTPRPKFDKIKSTQQEIEDMCSEITNNAFNIKDTPEIKDIYNSLYLFPKPFQYLEEYLKIIDDNIPECLFIYLQKTDFPVFLNNLLTFTNQKIKKLDSKQVQE